MIYVGLKPLYHIIKMKDFCPFAEVLQFIKQRNYLLLESVKKIAHRWQGLRPLEESTPLTFAKFLLSDSLSRMIHFIRAFKFNSLKIYPVVVASSGVLTDLGLIPDLPPTGM